MNRHQPIYALLFLSVVVIAVAGCNPAPQKEPETNASPPEKEPVAGNQSDAEKVNAELAKLSPEDRAQAQTQRVCPISGELLGSMGVPIKVTVNERSLFICCAGCEKDARENFDKHYAGRKGP